MKTKLSFPIAAMFFLMACGEFQRPETVFDAPCDIYDIYEATPANSLIAQKISNPCAAKKILGTLAKLPAAKWKKEYTQEFDKWASLIETRLSAGITYQDLQRIVVTEISNLNSSVGIGLMIISDGIFVFSEVSLVMPKDTELLLGLIAYLRDEVKMMELLS